VTFTDGRLERTLLSDDNMTMSVQQRASYSSLSHKFNVDAFNAPSTKVCVD